MNNLAEHQEGSSQGQEEGRSTFISAQSDAALDIRKICNALKRLSQVTAASVASQSSVDNVSDLVDSISLEMLKRLGFSSTNSERMAVVLAMVSEPVSMIVADALAKGASAEAIRKDSAKFVKAIVEISRSQVAAQMLNEQYPADMNISAALRVAAATAMAPVAIELARFSYHLPPASCLKEATTQVISSTLKAVSYLVPESSSAAARSTLTQSLLISNSRIYGACLRSAIDSKLSELSAMSPAQAQQAKEVASKCRPSESLGPVTEAYLDLLEVSVNTAAHVTIPEAPRRRPSP